MVAERVLPADVILDLARRLAGLRWPRPAGEVGAALGELGWRSVAASPHGVIARTTLPYGQGRAFVQLHDDRTDELAFDVSAEFGAGGPDREALRDAFTHAARAVGQALGEPSERLPGAAPEVRWRGARSTVAVSQPGPAVRLRLVPNEYLDDLDEADGRGL